MKYLKITFLGTLEPGLGGVLERKVLAEHVLPLEAIEKHGISGSMDIYTPWQQAQMFELRIGDYPDPEIVVPQQVTPVNHPKV